VADILKVLGQLNPAATTEETLYTVPATAQTTTSSLVICNRTGAGIAFRVSVHVAGVATDNKQYLYYDKVLAANDTIAIVLGMSLNESDEVRVYVASLGMSFNLFGVETT
jgi:hypothetical protein